jgi:hypothetical protein
MLPGNACPERKPANWDKRVSAAYLRMLGATQAEAARAVGCSERTIRRWEMDGTWSRAQQEARDRWMVNMDGQSRAALLKGVRSSDLQTARWFLERTDPRLIPAAQQEPVVNVYQLIQQLTVQQLLELEALPDEQLRQEVARMMRESAQRTSIAHERP